MTTAHARFSASGSSRWIQCPASIQMEAPFPDQTSQYAMEGTAAHELGERALRIGCNTGALVGEVIAVEDRHGGTEDFEVTEEMADYVQQYVDYVRSLPGELFVEQRVDFSHVVPDGFGTADAIVYDADDKTLTVIDLKYGQGVRVEAQENSQAQLYALGALNDYSWIGEIDTIRCVIVQPRLDHISEWDTTVKDLKSFARTAATAAEQALSEEPPFGPAESACRFCKAAGSCKPLAEHNLAIAAAEFGEPTTLRPVNVLAGDELAQILANLKLFQDWLKAVESHAISEIDHGHDIPGFKLVEGRSLRKWTDDREAEQALLDELSVEEAFTRKLISPSQAESLLGKKHPVLSDLVTKPPGKPTLVPESDKRPALASSAERDFSKQ